MTDIRLEKMVSVLLRTGVLLAAAVVLGGGLCFVIGHRSEPAGDHAFHGVASQYRQLGGILKATAQGDCRGIIQFGLLLLIATPVMRVGLSLVGFVFERDRTYIIVTAIVLAILLLSLLGRI